jgi:hypothetical protein
MALIGWIHFSNTFRDRVNTILDMIEEEGMVDELGVGAFRDAFADIFFPGTSTIQTRAKYFFIIPYLIQDYFNLKARQQTDFEKYLYEAEHELMWKLAAMYNFDRTAGSGVIGITKKPRQRIARRPVSVYWNGLRKLGFIKTSLSLSDYALRINETLEQKLTRTLSSGHEAGDDEDIELSEGHGIKVSTYQKNWKDDIDMPLSYEEADFFQKQILRTVPDSLLGQIISNKKIRQEFNRYKDFAGFTRAIISYPLHEKLKAYLVLAHDLNEVVKGLHLVYCNEINKFHYEDERHLETWKEWKNELYSNLIDVDNLTGENLISIAPRAGYYSKIFIQRVLDMVKSKTISYDELAALVIEQEKNIKGPKTRFKHSEEKEFEKGDAKSLSFLNYRYSNAKTIVRDIFNGLKEDA